MTYPRRDVEHVLTLWQQGHSRLAISRATGISRASIRAWINDPERARERSSRRGSGKACAGRCDPWDGLDERAYSYLLGQYLGDGCISEGPRAFRLRIVCTAAYEQILEEVAASIRTVKPGPVGRVEKIGCIELSSYSQHWPCLFPQHGLGRKHERPIVLADWQQEIVEQHPRPLLRGLIHSDGWRGMNVAVRTTELAIEYRTYSRYQFSNRSEDILKIFTDACDRLGVHWTQSNAWTIAVSRRKDVHYFDSFIGPKR